MARRRQKTEISLFPFLAVLVCTMGALILLLLVTTRQIRRDQQLAASPVTPSVVVTVEPVPVAIAEQPSGDDNAQLDELDGQIMALHDLIRENQSRLAAADESLVQQKTRLEMLREQHRGLTRELEAQSAMPTRTAAQLQTLQADVTQRQQDMELLKVRVSKTEQELLRKQEQLAVLRSESEAKTLQLHEARSALLALRRQLTVRKQQQSEAAENSGTKTLLEFSNPTGTTRTPIVIDVSERGFEFLPTGMRVTPADMEGFPANDNPLVAAVLALHRHRSADAIASEPYVLLLVRPTGCLPFYVAQRILSESHIHFGYELLLPDRVVDAGSPKDAEVRIVRTALLEALNRRETLYAMLREEAQAVTRRSDGDGVDNRRLVIRSDGAVVPADDGDSSPLDGRLYAGGEAPRRRLAPPRRRSPLTDSGVPGELNRPRGAPFRDVDNLTVERSGNAAAERSGNLTAEPSGDHASEPSGDRTSENSDRLAQTETFPRASRNGQLPLTTMNDEFPTVPDDVIGEARDTPEVRGDHGSSDRPPQDKLDQPDWFRDVDDALAATTERQPAATSSGGTRDHRSPPGPPQSPEMRWLATGESPDGMPGRPSEGGSADLSRLDPELARLLKSDHRLSRDLMTPVGVTVFLDPRHLTIGARPAVDVTPESRDVALAALLQGIAEEVAAARTAPGEPLLPIVKFIVSPGAEQLRIPLARELRNMGIPSASVYEIAPYVAPADTAGRVRMDELPKIPELPELPPIRAAAASPPADAGSPAVAPSSFRR